METCFVQFCLYSDFFMRYFIKTLAIVLWFSVSSFSWAVDSSVQKKKVVSALEDYYGEVNKQLNKRLDPSRQPFSAAEQAENKQTETFFSSISNPLKKTVKRVSATLPTFSGDFPDMAIKAYVKKNNARAALLEIKGLGTFFVKEGDMLGLYKTTGVESRLHVVEVNELNVVLRVGESGSHFVVQ